MNCFVAIASFLLLTSTWSTYQASSPQTAAPETSSTVHGVIPVQLSKDIDSSKVKTGSEIAAKTAAFLRLSNGTAIPSGAKVVGHLTEATAISKGDVESSLEMVFDRIQLASGEEVKIEGTVRAIAPAPQADTGAAESGTIPSYGTDAATMPPPQPGLRDLNAGKNSAPTLNQQSKGAVGFHNLEMRAGSLLTSNAKQIKLNKGTQMMLDVRLR